MDTLRILLTGAGCPGSTTMIRALRANGDTPVEVIGADMRSEASGRWICDEFHTVPRGDEEGFAQYILDLAIEVEADVVFPQITNEVAALAGIRGKFEKAGIFLPIANPTGAVLCDDKGNLYIEAGKIGVLRPAFEIAKTRGQLVDAIYRLGFPRATVCFKPVHASGSRGFVALRPGGLEAEINSLPHYIKERVVMEYINGSEYTVDLFCERGDTLLGFVKTRERVRGGLAYRFEVVDRPDLRSIGERLVRHFNLDGFVNIQFIGKTLIEMNPRVSTFVRQTDFNMPWLGLQYHMGLVTREDLQDAETRIKPGYTSIRFWDQVSYEP